jgi:hypothetical protein
MQDIRNTIEILYNRWLTKEANPEEVEKLFDLLYAADIENILTPLMKHRWEILKNSQQYSEALQKKTLQNIFNKYPAQEVNNDSMHRIHFLKSTWLRYGTGQTACYADEF